jgi:hypothetical protein
MRDPLGEDLDRYTPIEPGVSSLIDLPHPPGTDEGDDFVRAETDAGREGHGRRGQIIWQPDGLSGHRFFVAAGETVR